LDNREGKRKAREGIELNQYSRAFVDGGGRWIQS
jgi:hypothetical protein